MRGETNLSELERLEVLFREAMVEAEERGWYGVVVVKVVVQDGVIQKGGSKVMIRQQRR